MTETIEVKWVPTGSEAANVLVNSLEDLKRIAAANNVDLVLKSGKSYYVYTMPMTYRYDSGE